MDNLLCCIDLQSPYWNLVNFILAAFAVAVSIGYFLKPRLFFVGFVHDKKWKVRVINKNYKMAVKEVQCEIAVSEFKCFKKEKTLSLKKDKTLVLRKFKKVEDDYIFRTVKIIDDINKEHRKLMNVEDHNHEHDYKYIRIRILALNFMGIRKYYERIYTIENLAKFQYGMEKPEPLSYSEHKKQQKQEFEPTNCDENEGQ
jgi:hypothetical protein